MVAFDEIAKVLLGSKINAETFSKTSQKCPFLNSLVKIELTNLKCFVKFLKDKKGILKIQQIKPADNFTPIFDQNYVSNLIFDCLNKKVFLLIFREK